MDVWHDTKLIQSTLAPIAVLGELLFVEGRQEGGKLSTCCCDVCVRDLLQSESPADAPKLLYGPVELV